MAVTYELLVFGIPPSVSYERGINGNAISICIIVHSADRLNKNHLEHCPWLRQSRLLLSLTSRESTLGSRFVPREPAPKCLGNWGSSKLPEEFWALIFTRLILFQVPRLVDPKPHDVVPCFASGLLEIGFRARDAQLADGYICTVGYIGLIWSCE